MVIVDVVRYHCEDSREYKYLVKRTHVYISSSERGVYGKFTEISVVFTPTNFIA